jgi:transposase
MCGITGHSHDLESRSNPEQFMPPVGVQADRGPGSGQPPFNPVLKKVRVRGPVGRPRTRPDAVAGDKAYSSHGNHAHLRKRRIKAVIPEKEDQAANRKRKGASGGRPLNHDADLYKERNTVERTINRLRGFRAVATRYEKRAYIHLGTVTLAALAIWLRT